MPGSVDLSFPRQTGEALQEALAAHLLSRMDQVSAEERQRQIALIEQAQQEGR